MFIKPCEGCAVRDPITNKLLDKEGENKPDNQFWQKRLIDLSVIKAKKPNKPNAPQKKGDDK
ncbi:MAG: DUF2635 domain-containing protein [Rhizobiales bacterium]|nr:DUF2635 domain-containing protein [Hyphomicrobiales bacterium]